MEKLYFNNFKDVIINVFSYLFCTSGKFKVNPSSSASLSIYSSMSVNSSTPLSSKTKKKVYL